MQKDFFSTVKEIIKYGGATFAALVATSVYTTTDGFFIGNWVGTQGLSAMALVYTVTMFFIALGILFETGGSAVVSEKIAEKKLHLAEKIMYTNYFMAFIIGIIVVIAGQFFIEPLLNFLASTAEEKAIVDLSVSFLRISLCGLPFLIVTYLTGAFMRCIDKPMHVFYMLAATSIINIILDALFIIEFAWGIEGAALATVISQILGALITFWYFKFSAQKFKTSWNIGDFGYILQEFQIGGGFAIAVVMMCFIEFFLNYTLMKYDATHLLAVATVANIILSFVALPLNGLDTGIQPLISRTFATQKAQSMRVMRYSFCLTMIATFTIYIFLMTCTEELVRFFIADGEPITAEMIKFVRLIYVFQFFVGFYTWLSGIMAALEDEWRNIVIALSPLAVQVPLIYFLPKFFSTEYVALAYSLQDLAEATLAFLLIKSFFRENGITFKKIFSAN